MNFIGDLLLQMDRGSPGSPATAEKVLELCGDKRPENAMFFGDDAYTPLLVAQKAKSLVAAFPDEKRAERVAAQGLSSRAAGIYELPQTDGGFDFVWYNGTVEFDGVEQRLKALLHCAAAGGRVVYRALCWLIDPSPDTEAYCGRRFGIMEPFDKVIGMAKNAGFSVRDIYIAPKKDWTSYYKELLALAEAQSAAIVDDSGDAAAGLSDLRRETEMFELHSEEYSYVYFILDKK